MVDLGETSVFQLSSLQLNQEVQKGCSKQCFLNYFQVQFVQTPELSMSDDVFFIFRANVVLVIRVYK